MYSTKKSETGASHVTEIHSMAGIIIRLLQ
ncbi:hypothetical protein D104_02975 [Marinomonas profundimaris]|uniref:Uncharacterized protein n=1 Tax=Marinomonas profundimaris TaxID=1208321 RepID=W1RXN9_9GAMM|nr:hypothetical protein D104_02975 [Marinomonas profundimaris]